MKIQTRIYYNLLNIFEELESCIKISMTKNNAKEIVLTNPHDHVPEDLRQLCVGEGEGPEPEVGGRVGDGAEDVLDRVDALHCCQFDKKDGLHCCQFEKKREGLHCCQLDKKEVCIVASRQKR